MCVKPESLYFFNFPDSDASEEVRSNRFIETCLQVEWGKFEFQTEAYRLQKTNPRARFVFARILSGFGFGYNGHILNTNRSLVEDKFGKSDEVRRALEMFYERRIGDALCLKDLPWDNLVITPEFLGEKPAMSVSLAKTIKILRGISSEWVKHLSDTRMKYASSQNVFLRQEMLLRGISWNFEILNGEIAELVDDFKGSESKVQAQVIRAIQVFREKFEEAKKEPPPSPLMETVFSDDQGACQIEALADEIEKK
ncbi:hypothetical protein ACFL3M_03315 [Patescibacteria group bacterium]